MSLVLPISNLNIRIRTPKTSAELQARYNVGASLPSPEANQLVDLIAGMSGGYKIGAIHVDVDGQGGVQASGTFTLSSSVATDTATVAGVTFTEVASGAQGTAASGTFTLSSSVAGDTVKIGSNTYTEQVAGAPLYTTQTVPQGTTANFFVFDHGSTDTITAANLASAINGEAQNTGIYASSSGAVVTVTTVAFGTAQNAITLVGSTNITRSAATLAGGTNANPLHFNTGATDTATAANLAAAIAANATIGSSFVTTSSGAVVTVTAYYSGVAGNYVPLVGSTNIVRSGATLSGGVTPVRTTYHYGL